MAPIGDLLKEKNIILKGADALSTHGFTQVPNHVLRSDALSPGAKLAYAMLLSYAWHNDYCFPGQDRLAKDMGVTTAERKHLYPGARQEGLYQDHPAKGRGSAQPL